MAESESKTDVQDEIQTKSKTEEMEKESPDNKKGENESDVLREGNQNEASGVVDGQSTDLTQDGMDVVEGPRPVPILTRELKQGITDVIKRCGGILRGCLEVLLIYFCERKDKNDQTERPDKGNIDTKTDGTIQNATITNATITNATITNATLTTNLPYKVAAIIIGGVVVVAVVYVIQRRRNKDAADNSLEKIATHSMASDTEKAKKVSAGPEQSVNATVDSAVKELSSSCEFERCLSQPVEIEVLQTEDGPIEIIHIAGSTFSLTSLFKRFGRYIIQKLGVRKDEMPSSSG